MLPKYVFIETVHSPNAYSSEQINRAMLIAGVINRGRLLLLEKPANLDA